MSNDISSGSGSGFPGSDEEGIEYIDAIDSDLSTFLAQTATLILILGVALQDGINQMQQDLAALALKNAIKSDAQNCLHGALDQMRTINAQLSASQSTVLAAQSAGIAAQQNVRAALAIQKGFTAASGTKPAL